MVAVPGVASRWEGEYRPTHFSGVATIVTKLLSLVRADIVFCGQKDYQQAVLIQRLVTDLNLGCRVIVRPTMREADGLALSSRNAYLSPPERQAAPVLYRGLQAGVHAIRTGTRRSNQILRTMERLIAREPLARIDYLAVCDPVSLEPLSTVRTTCVLLGAVRIGTIRLIDNLVVSLASIASQAEGPARSS